MPGNWLVWESTVVPACISIWFLVMLEDSTAKSASTIRPLAAETFSTILPRLVMVWSRRLMLAPRAERASPISFSNPPSPFAPVRVVSAACALASEVKSPRASPPDKPIVALTAFISVDTSTAS